MWPYSRQAPWTRRPIRLYSCQRWIDVSRGSISVDAEGVNVSSEGRRQSSLGVPSL